ncbi:cytochrome b/b6 domain-containing protein [Poseidonocella sp. HB161398]|uniref:cytochrome b/b6 domain-containing protein n=1 Tax=Poseidonocella sp. HB161398 TaxID=2320855 RepID=UPI001107D956|nr:cytochrome b/b6 domain-containing protein [Poseidonocella sp. HB161398]
MDTSELHSGRNGARDVRVWDRLVRTVHWGVALIVLVNGFADKPGDAVHTWLGYTAGALVLLRLAWGVIGTRPALFTAFPPSPRRAVRHLRDVMAGSRDTHLSHNPLGALMVYNIWLTLLLLCVSGYMMGTIRFFGVAWVEDMHDLLFDWLMVSVVLHLAGVAFDSWRTKVPLVRAMVTGRKYLPKGVRAE